MKAKVKVTEIKEIEIARVLIYVPMDEIAQHEPAIAPALVHRLKTHIKQGAFWKLEVDIDTGKIINWPDDAGALDLYCYVRDGGVYVLLDKSDTILASIVEDYVPDGAIPDGGDELNLKIDATGTITNWRKNPDVSNFFPADDE